MISGEIAAHDVLNRLKTNWL